MEKILYVGIGGFLGAITRYLVTMLSIEKLGINFPYGTLIVNIIGCFVLGIVIAMYSEKFLVNENIRLFMIVGFTGGLTTFSAFSYETLRFIENYEIFNAILNAGLNIFLSIVSIMLGMALGKAIV